MFIILALIVLVAALNIISGLIMLVKDKGQDVAILRTMGATSGAILRVFFIVGREHRNGRNTVGLASERRLRQHRVACISSSLVDAYRGLLLPSCISSLDLPAKMDARETTAIVMMALALSYLATLYPAWRAARLDPVEALRYE